MKEGATPKKRNEPKVGDLSLPKGEASRFGIIHPSPKGCPRIFITKQTHFVQTNPN
jgi:hypothetical protein